MSTFATRLLRTTVAATALVLSSAGLHANATAAPQTYMAVLSGPAESPPNSSPAVGSAEVTIDAVAHTMRVQASFVGLIGTVTACHIHGPTAAAGTGTAGVMTTTPTFPGFPSGVTFGTYDNTFDMTLASSYNPTFLNNATNLGNTGTAEATLFTAIQQGRAYLNVHSTAFPGGEIRGFLQSVDPTPTGASSWGRVKSLYR